MFWVFGSFFGATPSVRLLTSNDFRFKSKNEDNYTSPAHEDRSPTETPGGPEKVVEGRKVRLLARDLQFRVDRVIKGAANRELIVKSYAPKRELSNGDIIVGGWKLSSGIRDDLANVELLIFLDAIPGQSNGYELHGLNSPIIVAAEKIQNAAPAQSTPQALLKLELYAIAAEESDERVEQAIDLLLQMKPDKAIESFLIDKSLRGRFRVRALALGARLESGDESAFEAILTLAKSREEFRNLPAQTHRRIGRAISNIVRSERYIDALGEMTKSEFPLYRRAACEALQQIGTPATAGRLD